MFASLAFVFLFGLMGAAVFEKMKLPRIIGMLLVGILIGPYALGLLDPTILSISGDLRKLALMLILLRAGLSLDLGDLKRVGRPAVLMAFVPATFEVLAVVLFAPMILGVTRVEAAVMGAVLTLPISSAAICAAFGLTGLAGGACVAGCCAHMVGFAVASWRENRFQGLAAQGLGTSMLQIPNLMRKPVLWLPAVAASLVGGPLATCVFHLEQNGFAIASGMGTCGLVGPIGVIVGWVNGDGATAWDIVGLILVAIVVPALVSWAVSELMRRRGLIKPGDYKLDL